MATRRDVYVVGLVIVLAIVLPAALVTRGGVVKLGQVESTGSFSGSLVVRDELRSVEGGVSLVGTLTPTPSLTSASTPTPTPTPTPTSTSFLPIVYYDLSYGSDVRHKLDLYLPQGTAGPVPVIAWFHGGGLTSGDKSMIVEQANYLVEHGFAVAAANYRLTTQDTPTYLPGQIEDAQAVVSWLRLHADEYGLDGTRIGASGGSAGAILSANLGTWGGVQSARGLSTRYRVECRDKSGQLKWTEEFDNLVVTAGLNDSLDKHLKGSGYTAAWYIGLTDGTPTVAAGDTMASHAGWTEVTAYDEAVRQTATFGSVAAGSVDNSASPAVFTCSTDGTTIGGAFLASVNTKGDATGILYGAGAFTGGDKTIGDGDTLTVTVTCTAAAA